ncbi:MAG TPA: hypothetical protein VMU55_03925 [Solirubrobacteraceae bacterium]|nr:hypothetical protein [Solirubrobacteraceae bacterium]
MRVSEQRYHNDILRYALAARMVSHEARTRTIRRWSGVSEGRVRELYRAYAREKGDRYAVRHRGPSPRQAAFFLRTAQIRSEAAALAALCSLLGVVPTQPLANARRELPSARRGELLCRAYEMFQRFAGTSQITLEHAVLLVTAVAQGTRLRLGHCVHCGGAIVFDPLSLMRRACSACADEHLDDPPSQAAPLLPDLHAQDPQRSLF